MALKKLDKAQQLALRNKAKGELERLQTVLSDLDTKKMVDNFKEKFSMCEIVYKVILDDHQYNKKGKHLDRYKIIMTQAPHVLSYAGYDYDYDLLNKLFGSEKKVGKRSVKALRDALTHKMSESAVNELRDRQSELNDYMDQFLDKIKYFDAD